MFCAVDPPGKEELTLERGDNEDSLSGRRVVLPRQREEECRVERLWNVLRVLASMSSCGTVSGKSSALGLGPQRL